MNTAGIILRSKRWIPKLSAKRDAEGDQGQDEASGRWPGPGPKEDRQLCTVRVPPASCREPQRSLWESSRKHEVATANLPTRHNLLLEPPSPRQDQQWKGVALQYWIPRRYKCNLEAGAFRETLHRQLTSCFASPSTQADTGWFIGELLNFPKAFIAPFARVITDKTWRHSRGRQSAATSWVISNLEIIFFLKQPGWSTAVVSRPLPLKISRGSKEMFLKLCGGGEKNMSS